MDTFVIFQELVRAAKERAPELDSRIDGAVKVIVTEGLSEKPSEVTSVAVYDCNGSRGAIYKVTKVSCSCPDYPKAPARCCKHRIALHLRERFKTQVQQQQAVANVNLEQLIS